MTEEEILTRMFAHVIEHSTEASQRYFPEGSYSSFRLYAENLGPPIEEIWAAEASVASPGSLNPGFLNEISHLLRKLLRRCLGWYTRSFRIFHTTIVRALDGHTRAIEALMSESQYSRVRLAASHAIASSMALKALQEASRIEDHLMRRLSQLVEDVAIIKSQVLAGGAASSGLSPVMVEASCEELSTLIFFTRLFHRRADVLIIRYRENKFRLTRTCHGIDTKPAPHGEDAQTDLAQHDLMGRLRCFQADSLGAILGIDVLRHLPLEDQAEFVRLCCEKLKSAGFLVLPFAERHCFNTLAAAFFPDAPRPKPVPYTLLKRLLAIDEVNRGLTPNLSPEAGRVLDSDTSEEDLMIPESFSQIIETRTYVIYGHLDWSIMVCRKLSRLKSR